MSIHASTIPLTRRLLGRYLMFGLACIFACVSLALSLAWRGELTESVAVVALPPVVMLLIGAFVLRRTVRLSESIELQLQQIATVSSSLDSTLRPLADSEPTAVGWNTILQKLHDQQMLANLQSRLQTSLDSSDARRWEAVANRLSDGIAVTNANHEIVLANNALLAVLGIEARNKVIGRVIFDLLGDALGSADHPALVQLNNGNASHTCDVFRDKEASEGVWRIIRTPALADAFETHSTLWIVRDVTQQKLAEQMRDQFVFTVAHELRTPLANIKAYAETLATQTNIDLARQHNFYNVINAEATRLARFVDEVLNVSQMEAGGISLVRHETDIERLLSEITDHIQPLAEKKQLQFEQQTPAKLPKLRVDKDKLSAALVNLLGNAVKYTPDEGQIRLIVEVGPEHLSFHVEDTGIGIAADELPRISEKFFRSNDERVRNITGSGLGLAFAQEVARLHGGKLAIRSELNKGSRFSLILPLS